MLLMVGTHKDTVARFKLGIVFSLLGDPTTSLEFSPLCLSLAVASGVRRGSNTTSTYMAQLDDMAELNI